jgi:serine/threonine-protein kinase PRP4
MSSPTSSDEGEIRDVVGSVEKATTTLPQFDGTSVDRQDRNRSSNSTSMSPERGYIARNINSYERSRSPYSDRPRGSKRSRDSDHDDYDDHNRDTRRFKVHYEDPKDHRHRSRISYEDIDHSVTSNSELRYDDRDRYVDKRHRTRSRSPYRSNRSERNGHSGSLRRDGNRHSVYQDIKKKPYEQDDRSRCGMDQSVSKRGESPMPAENARQEAKTKQGSSQYIDKSGNAFALEKYTFHALIVSFAELFTGQATHKSLTLKLHNPNPNPKSMKQR